MSSSSKRNTSTTNNTEITDSRVVGGDGSVNLSANDSNVSFIATDHGAVTGGLNLGSQAITAATKMAANTNATAGNMFSGALGFAGASQTKALGFAGDALDFSSSSQAKALGFAGDALDFSSSSQAKALGFAGEAMSGALGAVSGANERLALAYQSGQAGDQTQLKYAGFVVVGLAALAFAASKLK